jgi:hypothetical protein
MNPGRRGGKPANNRLSYGAAFDSSVSECSKHNTSSKVAVQGLVFVAHPLISLLTLPLMSAVQLSTVE